MKNLNFTSKSQSLSNISRLFMIPMATAMLSTMCVTTPVYAEATAGTLDSPNTSDTSSHQSSSESSSGDTGLDVDKMFAEVQSEYSDMKGKYTNLANNYGDIPTTNLSKTYVDYLQSLEDAKAKAATSIAKLSEDILSYYDIDFTIKCEKSENSEGFTLLGAKNVAGSGLVWNNNTPVESDEK